MTRITLDWALEHTKENYADGFNVLSVFTVRVVALRAVSSVTVAVSDVLMGDGTNAG